MSDIPPLQFTICDLLLAMVVTAVALGIILWLGADTAPWVLASAGALIGYRLVRPGGPFPAADRGRVAAWVVCGSMIGSAIGCAVESRESLGTTLALLAVAVCVLMIGAKIGMAIGLTLRARLGGGFRSATAPQQRSPGMAGLPLAVMIGVSAYFAATRICTSHAAAFGGIAVLVLILPILHIVIARRRNNRCP